jgi:hypothetical protein
MANGECVTISPNAKGQIHCAKTKNLGKSEVCICLKKIGAGEGVRTLDPDLGKVVLYH